MPQAVSSSTAATARLPGYALAFLVARKQEESSEWKVRGTATLIAVKRGTDQQTGYFLTAAHVLREKQGVDYGIVAVASGEEHLSYVVESVGEPGTNPENVGRAWGLVSVELPLSLPIRPVPVRATFWSSPTASVVTVPLQAEEVDGVPTPVMSSETLADFHIRGNVDSFSLQNYAPSDNALPAKTYRGIVFPSMSGSLMLDAGGYGFGVIAATDFDTLKMKTLARPMHRPFDIGGGFYGTKPVLALGCALIYG